MRTISASAIAALADGTALVSGAVKIACTPAMLVWGGYGQITLNGEIYTGVGDNGLAQLSGGSLGDSEQNISLSLSGIDPNTLALLSDAGVQRAPAQLWRLIFDGSGTSLLDAQIWTRGRLDKLTVTETIGGKATISASIEGAARGLGRSGQRMRTDADQRLINANDGGFSTVSAAGQKTLYWGGKLPISVTNLGWTPANKPSNIGGYDNYA